MQKHPSSLQHASQVGDVGLHQSHADRLIMSIR